MHDADGHSPKHKRSREKDAERTSKKRHKKDEDSRTSKKRKGKVRSDAKLRITDDDLNEEDMWVEKNIDMDGTRVSAFDTCVYIYSRRACRY